MAQKMAAKRRKRSFWKSKEAKRAYWVLGIPVMLLVGWYSYTLVFEFNKQAMTRMEAGLKQGIKNLAERARIEGFRTDDFNACQNIVDEYTTPRGWFYSEAAVHQLVGLPADATEDQLTERCVLYAKSVADMEKMSHHKRHVFVCGEAYFDVGGDGKYGIRADPQGRGALQNLDTPTEEVMPIPKGKSAVLRTWQIYNFGDGCIIVGLSKTATFRMSGAVDYEKEKK
jgi:hypothetical protein